MPALDLELGLGVVRGAADVGHAPGVEPCLGGGSGLRAQHGELSAGQSCLEEGNGPSFLSAPTTLGFGRTLMSRIIEGQFEGVIEHRFLAAGYSVRISIPLASLTA